MTVLVDAAVWPWRGRRWAHLVSDESLAELHDFAARLDLDPRLFQGDHYDITEEWRERAVALGAAAVDSRELVRRLRASGLRLSPAQRQAAKTAVRWHVARARGPDDPRAGLRGPAGEASGA